MRFADSNVFVHAFLKTERKLSEKDMRLKRASKEILERVEKNEKVMTSVVHLSEISNILESLASNELACEIIESILLNENIEVAEIDKGAYTTALELAKTYKISLNDCVACVAMKKNGIGEIYSFDADFDNIDGIRRIEN